MTERVPTLLQPFIQKFYNYSENPLSLGISDFCSFDQHGQRLNDDDIAFPYVLVLKPVYNQTENTIPKDEDKKEVKRFDNFINDLLIIPSGSVLFDIYACPDPKSTLDPKMIQRIGRIITTSEMISSHPDDGLFFRHQKKEEDFDLRPHWRKQVNTSCTAKCEKAQGTIGTLVGATFLESNINEKEFLDFEYDSKYPEVDKINLCD